MSFITSPIRKSVGITKAVLGMIQVDLMAPGFSPAGEYFLMPDLKSLRTSTLEPRYAYFMGQFEQKFGETKEVGLCPRTILKRVVKEAQGDYNISFLAGFETEVVFLEDSFPPTPISNHAWSTSLSLRTNSIGKSIVEEIHDVLSAAGVEVQQFHGESAPGQYEIITGPLPPVEAVDALVFTRDTIYNVAAKYGVRATLYPKVFAEACLPPYHILRVGLTGRWDGIACACVVEERQRVTICRS
jgi:glutamine synthetase